MARRVPTGDQGSKVYVLCVEPKEHKHLRPGTRPGGSVTGVTEKLFMCQMFMCLFRPLVSFKNTLHRRLGQGTGGTSECTLVPVFGAGGTSECTLVPVFWYRGTSTKCKQTQRRKQKQTQANVVKRKQTLLWFLTSPVAISLVVFLMPRTLVSTRTLLLKRSYRCQGYQRTSSELMKQSDLKP